MMRITNRMIATLGLILFCSIGTSPATAAQDTSLPIWSLDSASLPKLKSPEMIGGYAFHLPIKYLPEVNQKYISNSKAVIIYFYNFTDRSKPYNFIHIVVMKNNQKTTSENPKARAHRMIQSAVQTGPQGGVVIAIGNTEYGLVNSILMARLRFSYTEMTILRYDGPKHYGLCYIGIDGGATVEIVTTVPESDSQVSFPLVEACALTLRKQ